MVFREKPEDGGSEVSGPYDSRAIANAFIDRFNDKGLLLTHMQLQKMVYFAHGWHLAIFNRPLSKSYFSAWKWGPVNTQIYNKFKKFGALSITGKAVDGSSDIEYQGDFDSNETRLLDKVFSVYGELSGPKLSHITHAPDSPWSKVWDDSKGEGSPIPDELLQEYFSKLNGNQPSS
jgi:uncharacterized phage-associated protein